MGDPLDPQALTLDEAAEVLTRCHGKAEITPPMIVADWAAGAPANADGTLNLIHYTAWLAREAE